MSHPTAQAPEGYRIGADKTKWELHNATGPCDACGDCAICEEARADEAGDMKRRERKEREWWGDD